MVFKECDHVKHSCSSSSRNSETMEHGNQTDIIVLDFAKALIRSTIVSHSIDYITMEVMVESTSGSKTALRADSRLLWWMARGWTSLIC